MSTYRVGDYVRALIDQDTGRVVGWRTPADEDQLSDARDVVYLGRTAEAKLGDWVSVKDKGAIADGAADDSAAFDALSATNGGYVPPGNYRITGTRTWAFDLLFAAGARLTFDTGCTVTMTGNILAWGNQQIFYGNGTLAGLRVVNAAWFAGDKMDLNSDCYTELAKAYNACATSGTVQLPGQFTVNGVFGIPVQKGQRTVGVGRFFSGIAFTGAACNGFAVSNLIGASFDDFGFSAQDASLIATSGVLIDVQANAGYTEITRVIGRCGYIGFSFISGGCRVSNFDLLDCEHIGVLMTNTNDVFINNFLIASPLDRMQVTGISGAFVQGELLTGGTSGAVGALEIKYATNNFKVFSNGDVNFQVGEVVTGVTSGATATISVYKVPLQLGGIRLFDKAEAFICSNGDIIGGKYSITTGATVNGVGTRPAYNKFTDVYFDSADEGAYIEKSVEFDWNACWWSNRPNNGCVLESTDGMRFTGGGVLNCAAHGMVVNSTAVNTHFTNFTARSNSTKSVGTYHGIFFNNAIKWTVTGGTYSNGLGFVGQQGYGLAIGASCDNFRVRDPVVTGNNVAPIFDGTPDTADKVIDAIGYATRNSGTGTVAVGQTVVQITHGLAATPRAQDITVGFTTSPASSSVGSLYLAAIGATTFQIVTNTAVVTNALGVSWSARIKGA